MNTELKRKTMLVEIDEKWVRRINSPMGFVAGTLSGVSVTFVPLGMYYAGRSMEPSTGVPMAILCMTVILYCGFFHYKLAHAVIAQVYKAKHEGRGNISEGSSS